MLIVQIRGWKEWEEQAANAANAGKNYGNR